MTISPAGLKEQATSIRSELLAACERVLDSGWYVLGPEVESFEREFAEWSDTPLAVGVASGTEALQLALWALGVGAGDEVIVPANAVPTPYGVTSSGADVVFADMRESDLNIDPVHVDDLITDRTRAIVAVHLYGHPADVDAIRDVIGDRDIKIVEDCAQAHGAAIDGRRVGSLGDIAAWSFYPTKNLGAYGDGGAVTTQSEATAAKLRALRMYGEERRYHSPQFGINSRLDELQAAFLRVKLARLDATLSRRRDIAAAYDDGLGDIVTIPPVRSGVTHARHLYPVQVDDRDRVLSELQDAGIPAAIHYPIGAHHQPCFAASGAPELPVTDAVSQRLLSLPMHPELTDDQVATVIDAVKSAVSSSVPT